MWSIEIIKSMSSDQNGITPEISNRKISGKCSNIWKTNNILLNNPGVKGNEDAFWIECRLKYCTKNGECSYSVLKGTSLNASIRNETV